MTKTELRRAATLLRDQGQVLRNSYLDHQGHWYGDPAMGYTASEAETDYNELRDLARKLDGLARVTPAKGSPW